MKKEDKLKCILIDFEQGEITLSEASNTILRLFSVSGSDFSAFRSPKFNNNKMKREFNFYKSYYAGFRAKDLLPIFSFTKNVQGWSFTRVWSLNWFTYAVSFSLIKRSDLHEDRGVAHEKNVKKYMMS